MAPTSAMRHSASTAAAMTAKADIDSEQRRAAQSRPVQFRGRQGDHAERFIAFPRSPRYNSKVNYSCTHCNQEKCISRTPAIVVNRWLMRYDGRIADQDVDKKI
jgi:hypothetical protein